MGERMRFNTLDDFEVEDKTVIVRVDINSPIDPEIGEILDDNRIRNCSSTLTELSEKGARVVVIAHQGRPASEDFTTMERHAERLSEVLGLDVDYIDDLFGPAAREAVSNLDSGDVLLLENARFYSEEVINREPREQAQTHFVRKLSPLADLFVNDAFAAAHRSQPSLVGFGVSLPAMAGRLMEKEIEGLGKARDPEHPCVYVLGGVKVDDSLSLTEHVLESGIADKVLVGGLVGQVALAAQGYALGDLNMGIISKKGYKSEIDRAKGLLSDYGEKIILPEDLRVEEKSGEATVISVDKLPSEFPVYDIGDKTVENYSQVVKNAKTVVANGPLGVFEKDAFAEGTNGVLEAISGSVGFTVIGGGHLVASARELDVIDEIDHVSTGGGSCLNFLSGEELPVLKVLESGAIDSS